MIESKIELTERLRRENRWIEASKFKDDAIKRLRSEEGLSRDEARERAWELMAEEYFPLPVSETETESIIIKVQGLGTIPPSWPVLPDNASLQSELNWVQSQRLLVVEERSPGVVVVHLERARCPAPSWSALSWLETSIRSYAKYVDIVVKSIKDEPDRSADIPRKPMPYDEICGLLAEMHHD